MNRYLTGLDTVLDRRGPLAYIDHRPESRAAMRQELRHEIVRAEALRPMLSPAERRRLAIELREVRIFLRLFEHTEAMSPCLLNPETSTTLQ